MNDVKLPSIEGKQMPVVKPFVKGFKYPIYPNEAQKELFAKTFGCCRFVWNKALDDAKKEHEYYISLKNINTFNTLPKPRVSGFDFVNRLMSYKSQPESLWLNEVNAVSLQQTMLHLGSAFSTFFKNRKGYPQFKSKSNRQSFTIMSTGFRFKDNQLFIAKSKDPLAVNLHRPLPSDPSSAVISMTPTGKYFISFICEYYPEKVLGKGLIGIDLGLKDFLVTSDGVKIPNPKNTKKYQQQLKRRQQALSRKKKGSKNRNKARLAVAKVHEKISNSRNDFQHKLSRTLVNENQVIGLEKLIPSNMIKNHSLAKSIQDAAWGEFTNKVEYKARETQYCKLVYMDCFYPSTHICNVDQYKLDYKLSLSDRTWVCPQCGTVHDRDINAALNIRNEAILTIELMKLPKDIGSIVLLANRPH